MAWDFELTVDGWRTVIAATLMSGRKEFGEEATAAFFTYPPRWSDSFSVER
jgi:hypothetical protein